tara:strand:+ start:305 stop:757 length:453 start_codon:yes stop_codon:yes gene_type:complete
MITQKRLKELFSYRNDGFLVRKQDSSYAKAGDITDSLHKSTGYYRIMIDRISYHVHILIYIFHFETIPKKLEIDHINRIRTDNRIENLRAVTRAQNQYNVDRKGYYFSKSEQKYRVRLSVNKKRISLGLYETEEEAAKVYLAAKQEYDPY